MVDLYGAVIFLLYWLNNNRFWIANMLNNLGVGAYVAGFIELLKGNLNSDTFLMGTVGLLFTWFAYWGNRGTIKPSDSQEG